MMDRRAFIMDTFALLAAPLPSGHSPAAGVHRIGYRSPGFLPTAANPSPGFAAFRARLAELGYVEGQTLQLELRYAEGDLETPVGTHGTSGSAPTECHRDQRVYRNRRHEACNRHHSDRHVGSLDLVRDGLVQSLGAYTPPARRRVSLTVSRASS
jgi:hypothetical protein